MPPNIFNAIVPAMGNIYFSNFQTVEIYEPNEKKTYSTTKKKTEWKKCHYMVHTIQKRSDNKSSVSVICLQVPFE